MVNISSLSDFEDAFDEVCPEAIKGSNNKPIESEEHMNIRTIPGISKVIVDGIEITPEPVELTTAVDPQLWEYIRHDDSEIYFQNLQAKQEGRSRALSIKIDTKRPYFEGIIQKGPGTLVKFEFDPNASKLLLNTDL